MPAATHPPIPLLEHCTDFIRARDGSSTLQDLLPSLLTHVNAQHSEQQTALSLSDVLHKTQHSASVMRSALRETARIEAEYGELQEKMAATRPPRRAALLADTHNSLLKYQYKHRKIVAHDRQSEAEEALATALAELRQRNAQWKADRKEEVKEAKEAIKEERAEKRRDRERRGEEEKQATKASQACWRAQIKLMKQRDRTHERRLQQHFTAKEMESAERSDDEASSELEHAIGTLNAKVNRLNAESRQVDNAAQRIELYEQMTALAEQLYKDTTHRNRTRKRKRE